MKARRICDSSLLKQEFLKKWIKGLRIYNSLKQGMSLLDRKKAIKSSADMAIASASRKASTQWSRALVSDVVSRDCGTNRILAEQILGHKVDQKKPSTRLITCSKKILRRSHLNVIARRKARRRVVPRSAKASSTAANKLVEKRTRVLRSLVPGGQKMDETCLIQETLDYIVSLRVQVDVMRRIAGAADRFLVPPIQGLGHSD